MRPGVSSALNSVQSSTHLAEREQDTLEERCRLIQRLLERLVQVHVQFAHVLPHVFSDIVEQNTLQEHSHFCRFQIRHKNLGTGERRMRRPFGRLSKRQELRPMRQRREDFERFWQRTRFVSRKQEADSGRSAEELSGQSQWPVQNLCGQCDGKLTSCTPRRLSGSSPFADRVDLPLLHHPSLA